MRKSLWFNEKPNNEYHAITSKNLSPNSKNTYNFDFLQRMLINSAKNFNCIYTKNISFGIFYIHAYKMN